MKDQHKAPEPKPAPALYHRAECNRAVCCGAYDAAMERNKHDNMHARNTHNLRYSKGLSMSQSREVAPMAHDFKVGDHVEWNSEAGRVRGTIKKKITSEITFKGYKVHASKEEPQYLIKSDKTDHLAMHKGSALKKIGKGES